MGRRVSSPAERSVVVRHVDGSYADDDDEQNEDGRNKLQQPYVRAVSLSTRSRRVQQDRERRRTSLNMIPFSMHITCSVTSRTTETTSVTVRHVIAVEYQVDSYRTYVCRLRSGAVACDVGLPPFGVCKD